MPEGRVHPLRLYGHRGDPTHFPEGTLPSFRGALEAGANAIELDIHLTAEDRAVCCHDPDTLRATGEARTIAISSIEDLRVMDFGWAFTDASGARPFLGQSIRMPTLDEVLEQCPGVPINVDIKPRNEDAARVLVDLVHRYEEEHRVLLTSFHTPVLRRVRELGYRGGTGLSRREIARLLAPGLLRRVPEGAVAVQVPLRSGPIRFDTRDFVDRAHDLGLRVDYFTVNDRDTASRLLELGADGIMTDDPAALAPLFEAAGAI